MFGLILKEYKSQMTWKNFKKFFRYDNWMIPFYLLIYMPLFMQKSSPCIWLGMGISIGITYTFNAIVGNELPEMLYFTPVTEQEKRKWFRTALIIRIGLLLLIYWICILGIFLFGKADMALAAEGMLYLCISGIPPLLRVGNGMKKEGFESFYGCDLCGHLLLLFGYFITIILRLEYPADNGEMIVLSHTIFGKIVLFCMMVLVLFYLYRFYPKVEEYVLDYERVRYVSQQKEKLYQGKIKKR